MADGAVYVWPEGPVKRVDEQTLVNMKTGEQMPYGGTADPTDPDSVLPQINVTTQGPPAGPGEPPSPPGKPR